MRATTACSLTTSCATARSSPCRAASPSLRRPPAQPRLAPSVRLPRSTSRRWPRTPSTARPPTPARPQPAAASSGVEPVRHQVKRGETAYTIARLYDVTPRALAEWNGLGQDFSLREGQYLLIPVVQREEASTAQDDTPAPGSGSPTPQPPSSSAPLPEDEPSAASSAAAEAEAESEPVADIGQSQPAAPAPAASNAAMAMPVSGAIIREYSKGRNDGIDISADAGTPVKAAASGTVAAITKNTENVQILVIRHPDEVLSVYTHVDQLKVSKGDAVSRGQTIGAVRAGDPAFLHFEVRKGFESVDPLGYLQ
ncbi:Lipoprotein NlpD [Salipiger mucosus DSM 16094]|uniref:Lipoprotein NlpD n=1 Tax=Salipiger mucosus DSM 16094 TaxID=1123237 RepID=S9QK94_9RHOB|nr:Lipoprotein NlpD [Salipiger mucosus DSM 16094]